MYSQQQQPNHYPVMDAVNYSNTTIPYLPAIQSNTNNNNNNNNNTSTYSTAPTNQPIVRQTQLPPPPPPPHHHHHHQQQVYNVVVPPEPVPSATEAQPTPPLSIPQLADFASTMVFLMWHARRASVMALHDVSKIQQTHTDDQDPGHSRETANIANCKSSAFKKFCEQILSATQLSESVILLSLKYIAMLLQNNPNIQGADGSEYRLFTVALMLANKFLDDNTFTNKTWSDVSGMKVTDLNIMELEFLDVLRFRLFIRNDEYERWKSAILLFRSQLENANEAQKQEQQQQLFEETFKSIVTPVSVQQQQQQSSSYHQQQYLLMLSKGQQPQYPTQPLNRPLTRVPLRIPHQPVWRTNNNAQQQQQQINSSSSIQAPTMYDTNMVQQQQPQVHHHHQQQQQQSHQQAQQQQQQAPPQQQYSQQPVQPSSATRPYMAAAPASSSVMQPHSSMTVMIPTPISNSSSADYYHTKQPVYDNGYAATSQPNMLPNDIYHQQRMDYSSAGAATSAHYPQRQQQQQQNVYSQPMNTSSRLSGINLTTQAQDFGASTASTATNYYYMTPPATAKPTTPDGSYYNKNQSYMVNNNRPNNNGAYYGNEMMAKSNAADYSAYDMSASQQPNDLYSQAPAQAYQQQHQYRPTQQVYTNPPPVKKYNGPTLEDPVTAAASYRRK